MSEPLLYDTVDKLYHSVMDIMPQAVQDLHKNSKRTLEDALKEQTETK